MAKKIKNQTNRTKPAQHRSTVLHPNGYDRLDGRHFLPIMEGNLPIPSDEDVDDSGSDDNDADGN